MPITLSETRPSPVTQLREALIKLTEPQLVEVDDRAPQVLPCVVDQLEEATEPSGGASSSRGDAYKAPAALNVISLLGDIDNVTSAGMRRCGYHGRLDQPRRRRMQAWGRATSRLPMTHFDYLADAAERTKGWATRAQQILAPDPQTVETRAQPCPNCGRRTAMVWSEDLCEKVQRASLYLDKNAMVVYCRCCPAQWAPHLWGLLARVLDESNLRKGSTRCQKRR